MPPKIKVTEEAIIDAAMSIIKTRGIAELNAREIARILGCSIQPIFRNFGTMDNLKRVLYEKADAMHSEYLAKGLSGHQIPFLGLGMAYVDFARQEKYLYHFLFMSEAIKGKSFLDMVQGEENQEIVGLISEMTQLTRENSEELFVDIWLMIQGIASLVSTNDFRVSEEQVEKILKDTFSGLVYQLKK